MSSSWLNPARLSPLRIDERLVEVVTFFHLHEVAQLAERRRLVFDP
jgi:hypothetical protein